MPKSYQQKGAEARGRNKRSEKQIQGDSLELPLNLQKKDCLYLKGVIAHSSRGIHHVSLENGLDALCTARKMESLRVGLMEGDKVICEIPATSLSPTEKLRGRVVWRLMIPKRHRY